MAHVIAITNQKGGVGKTTTSVNLAASLAEEGKRVLLIDMDPQGNATMGSGIEKGDLELSVYDALMEPAEAKSHIVVSEAGKFDVLPANADLTAAEVHLLQLDDKEKRLRKVIQQIDAYYDYVLIDCPPSLNMLTLNSLVAANSVIIPMQCEYYALEGLSALLNTIGQVQDHINPELEIEGILRTMYDPRNRLSLEVSRQLFNHFADKVYRTVIPRNVRLAEAPSFGVPVMYHDRSSSGSKAYLALAGEIIRRNKVAAS
ncbi:ParA family protein [Kangiella aquimarina]|uniref:AAA family ATPase n=1 Tax=Kangiella aquimarina TaxID=261965 RepID=A0ABZ0X4W1_9GAMM|nr:AAA family ATPase [Kangiella aquimarina]WQG85642.1 AAA family ATPase [Kangiella aquimarina]